MSIINLNHLNLKYFINVSDLNFYNINYQLFKYKLIYNIPGKQISNFNFRFSHLVFR